MINGIKLPRLYIAENNEDVRLAREKGIPFVRWTQGQDNLIKMLLRPTLEKLFPHIMWNRILGPRRRFCTKVEIQESSTLEKPMDMSIKLDDTDIKIAGEPHAMSQDDPDVIDIGIGEEVIEDEDVTYEETATVADGERTFLNVEPETVAYKKLRIQDYVGDMNSYVNIDVLQKLKLMPAFIGDILDCVRINIGSGVYWSEGYNKKRALPVGRYDSARQRPNLIILDVSGSIPRGISATMISLVDTLRSQLTADLIITGSISRFYPMGSKLPDPQRIRNMFNYGNESYDFFNILNMRIRGRHYGHVFSFGDDDTPKYEWFHNDQTYSLAGTTVDHVHHYHTGLRWRNTETDLKTGYAKWCHMLSTQPAVDYDTSWCEVISH
jgi:hypothetical protein